MRLPDTFCLPTTTQPESGRVWIRVRLTPNPYLLSILYFLPTLSPFIFLLTRLQWLPLLRALDSSILWVTNLSSFYFYKLCLVHNIWYLLHFLNTPLREEVCPSHTCNVRARSQGSIWWCIQGYQESGLKPRQSGSRGHLQKHRIVSSKCAVSMVSMFGTDGMPIKNRWDPSQWKSIATPCLPVWTLIEKRKEWNCIGSYKVRHSPQRQLCIWTPSIRHVITEDDYQPLTQGLNSVFLSFEFKILRGSAMTYGTHWNPCNTCLVEPELQPRQTSDTLPAMLVLTLALFASFSSQVQILQEPLEILLLACLQSQSLDTSIPVESKPSTSNPHH